MNVAHERRFRADVVSEYDGCVHDDGNHVLGFTVAESAARGDGGM